VADFGVVIGRPPAASDAGSNVVCRGRFLVSGFWVRVAVRRLGRRLRV